MANGAIFNTAIGQQFSGNNRKTNTLINVNDGNPIDTEVTPEATPKEKAEATPQYRLNKEKVLDNALRDRGLVLQPSSKKDQDKYWKGLTKEMQDQMSQYYKDGYSFAGARALLEQQYGKNPQSLKVQRAGEAKGSDTWIGAVQDSIPMKIADWVNILGKGTEYLMNAEQQVTQDTQGWINEKIGAREGSTLFRDRANKSLKEKIDALPEEKVSQLTAEYNEDSNRGKMRRKAYGTLDNYIEEKTKSRWQEMLGIGTIGGDPYKGFAWDRVLVNAPRSALDLATASLYAQTNPVDNLSDLAYLFTTKEGRGILKDQYGSLDKLQETMESDPFGFISDLMDAKDLISRSKSRLKQVEGKVNQSKLNKKKNEVTKLNKEIQDELKEDREKNTATSFDTLEKGGKLYELEKEQKGLEEKQNSINESKEKWDERAQQASDLSDVFSTEPINKAIIGYLSEKGGIGKTLAYWYSLTQDPLSTIWNGVATEKQVEQTKPQTLDELDEGKEPEKETITVTNKVAPGISDSKAVQNVGEVRKRIRDKWEERTTGLTPDMKARIQQNPYVKAYWDQIKATIEDEGLSNQEQIIEEQFLEEIGNELLARIEKEENRVEETGVMYNNIRDLPQTFDFTSTAEGIANTFDRAGITIRPDGSLFFRNWSEAMTTDRSHAQILWNLMQKFINGQALTASEFLDLRSQLKAIENYKKGMDPTSAGKSAMLARQLRTEINKLAHKEIPGLSEIDAQYHKQISYLQQLKKDITYAQGPNSGKVRSNFYSIIRNINSANRKQYAGIIAGIFPEIKDRVEAVRLMPKLIKAYQKNSGLLQSVVNMPKLLSAAQIASGDGFIKSAMTLLIGQFVEEGLIRPADKKLRQATIDEVINELDPIAKLKLEEAIKNAQDGEKLTKEEEMIIQEVTKKIAQSIEEYRENLPKLPSPKADVVDEKGNVTLGRGQPKTPEPQRRSIIEINLYKPEAKKEEIQKIQEENNVDQQTAEKIDNTLQAFLEEMGATNGTVNVEQVDYNNFSTPTLNELRVSDRIPQTEKEKIETILKERLEHTDDGERQKMDKYFAVKIDNLNEEEQRIGKVGKNKVNKEYQDQQKRAHETKKEKIIKEIEQFYFDGDPDSAIKAEDKFKELEATPRDVINSYKKSQNYIYESAERELLNRYLKEWDKQPKFTKNLSTKQSDVRNELLNTVELNEGYEIETNDYNDRYVRKENGQIVDRGAITYNEDGTISIIAQDINGFLESGIVNYLPDNATLKISGMDEVVTIGDLRNNGGSENFRKGSSTVEEFEEEIEGGNYDKEFPIVEEVLTPQEKKDGLKLYKDAQTDKTAFNKFIILKQQPGYLEELGLDRAEVNKNIKNRSTYKEGVKELSDRLNKGTSEGTEYLGFQNSTVEVGKAEGYSALESLVRKVTGPKNGEYTSYLVKAILTYNSTMTFKILSVLADQQSKNRLKSEGFMGSYAPLTDSLRISDESQQTASHEVAHYIDSLWGRELFGGSQEGPRYLTNKMLDVRGLTSEQLMFYRRFNKFVDGLIKNVPSDKKISEFFSSEKYWTLREEVFARFGEAFIDWVQNTAKEGVNNPNYESFATINGDVFTRSQFEEFIGLIQEKSGIEGLKEAKTPSIEFASTGKGYFKQSNKVFQGPLVQESLFDEPKKTAQDYDKIVDRISGEMAVYNMRKNYDSKSRVWMGNIIESTGKERTGRGANDLIQLYQDYKRLEDLSKDERLMNYLDMYDENTKQGDLYKMLKQIQDEPVDFSGTIVDGRTPDELDFMKQVLDLDSYARAKVADSYDPDVIERHSNISGARGLKGMSLEKLRKLKASGQKLLDQGQDEIKSGFYMEPENNLLKNIKERKNSNMFEKKSVNKVADRAYDILKAVARDVEMMNDNFDLMNGEWKEGYESYPRDIFTKTITDLANSYNPDVDKWQENLGKKLKETISKFKGFEGVKRFKTLVGKPKLTELKSYIERLKDTNPELIKDPDVKDFVSGVQEKNAELEAKGANTALRKLVAQSLMTLENFEKQIKNFGGKSPMPSIAVMDKNIPHTWNSDATIDLVFGKDTVDPKADSRNKIYGSDAWTPMFPSTTLNEKPLTIDEGISYAEKLIDKFGAKEIFTHGAIGDWEGLAGSTEGLRDYFAGWIGRKMRTQINRGNTENLKFNIGQIVREAMMDYYQRSGLPERKWDTKFSYDQVVESVSDIADEMKEKYTGEEVIPARYFNTKQPNYGDIEHVNNVVKQIVEILPEQGIEKLHDEGYIEGGKMNSFEDGIFRELSDAIEGIEDFPNNTPQEAGEEILELFVEGYGFDKETILPYVEDIFGGLEDTPKDRPYNAQNALEAMLNQKTNREVEEGTFDDMARIKGSELNDIEEVRGKNYFRGGHNELKYDTSGLERRYNDLVRILAEENDWLDGNSVNDGNVMDEIKYAIKKSYDPDPAKFKEQLIKVSKEEGFVGDLKYDEEVLKRMIDVIEKGRKSPVRYTESKPERIVDLYNEVQAVLAPTEDRARVEEIVKGTPLEGKVTYYNNQDMDNPRQRKLDELQKKYGNVFFQMGGVIMPIGMLLKMAETLGGGGDDDQQEEIA